LNARMLNRCPRCGFFDDDLRSLDQNAKMWAMLGDISSQVRWPVNGESVLMTSWDWKDLFTASLKKHSRVAMGLDGGFVILGGHTSRMTKSLMAEMIELMLAFGAERDVHWRDRAAA
jgi:hypothetical protein